MLQSSKAQIAQPQAAVTLAQNQAPIVSQDPEPLQRPVSDLPLTPAQSAPPDAQQSPSAPSSEKKSSVPSAPHKKTHPRKPKSTSSKVVVRNGSTTDPSVQFSTSGSPDQASRDRQNIAGLLATTNSNIQKISGHQLNANQQDMLTQIKSYMQQVKTAEDSGDLQSAQNLALKAQLLSTELIKK